jgi:hypothetical protein
MNSQSSPQTFPEPSGSDGATSARPPLEARLVQAGKLSMGQLAQAHRDRLESGKPLIDLIVERGWVTPEDIAEAGGETGTPAAAAPPAAPEPQPIAETPAPPPVAPEPVAERPAAAAVTSGPQPEATGTRVLVGIRLANGDLVPAGHANGADTAATLGQAVVAELMQTPEDEWPFFHGRFLKPDTIVSVDLVVED